MPVVAPAAGVAASARPFHTSSSVSIRDSNGGVSTSQERAQGSLVRRLLSAHLRGGGGVNTTCRGDLRSPRPLAAPHRPIRCSVGPQLLQRPRAQHAQSDRMRRGCAIAERIQALFGIGANIGQGKQGLPQVAGLGLLASGL